MLPSLCSCICIVASHLGTLDDEHSDVTLESSQKMCTDGRISKMEGYTGVHAKDGDAPQAGAS